MTLSLFFLFFIICVAAFGRGNLAWNSLPAKEKKLRLVVLGIAIVGAVIRTYWVEQHAASFLGR